MDVSLSLRHLLRLPAAHRTAALLQPMRPQQHMFTQSLSHTRSLSTPRILQPSFWASMIPKPLRTRDSASTPRPKEWNPATPYIILGLLVGSQAIQILWLKQERNHEMRRAEAKIGVLREVIERVQRGEKVDVEEVLGTGVEGEEREWRQVLRDMQDEEVLFQSKKKRRAMREAAERENAAATAESQKEGSSQDAVQSPKMQVESLGGVKFY